MRIVRAGMLVGLLLNAIGWLGNVFLLGPLWRSAFTEIAATPWRESPWRDVISLAPDFIYGIAMCWLYVGLAPRYGATFATALRATPWSSRWARSRPTSASRTRGCCPGD